MVGFEPLTFQPLQLSDPSADEQPSAHPSYATQVKNQSCHSNQHVKERCSFGKGLLLSKHLYYLVLQKSPSATDHYIRVDVGLAVKCIRMYSDKFRQLSLSNQLIVRVGHLVHFAFYEFLNLRHQPS